MAELIGDLRARYAKQFQMSRWSIVGWAFLFLMIAAGLQFNIAYPWDDDTAYHAAVGQLIRSHGFLKAFPWTPFSWMASHYADKELLFHLLFVPFAGLDWITASQIVGTLAGTTLLLTVYYLLRTENVRYPGLWTLICLSGSVIFLFRFVLVRPHLLSIPLGLLFLLAALQGRFLVLAAVSMIYPWAYVAYWQLPFLLLMAAEAARFLSGGRVQWKPAAVAAGGIAAGIAIHPNAANLVSINWMEMVDLLFQQSWGSKVGFDQINELKPYPFPAWIQGLLFSVLMTITASIIAWKNRRNDRVTLAFALAALGFCVLTIRSARFSEYYVPFSVAAMALASRSIKWRFLPHAVLCVSMIYLIWVGSGFFMGLSKRQNFMPQDVASFLQQQIPKGAQVFTTDWEFTGLYMLTLPDRRFIVGLDPTFLYKQDPERYRLWYQICHEPPDGSAELIRRRFGARYVLGFSSPKADKLFSQLVSQAGVRTLLATETWTLFDLGTTSP